MKWLLIDKKFILLKILCYYVKLAKIKIKKSEHIFMIHEVGMLYKLDHPSIQSETKYIGLGIIYHSKYNV